MLKSLYPAINWSDVQIIGFDVDGTLYNEEDFIAQVYGEIVNYLLSFTSRSYLDVYNLMLSRWRERGSSYPFIFLEALEFAGILDDKKKQIEAECLHIYRNFDPNIKMTKFAIMVIEFCYKNFEIFLVTDGNCVLQNKKIASLGLRNWFDSKNIGISGCFGGGYYKPSLKILNQIKLINEFGGQSKNIVYFGDRNIDSQFAKAAGFQYVNVKSMRLVE